MLQLCRLSSMASYSLTASSRSSQTPLQRYGAAKALVPGPQPGVAGSRPSIGEMLTARAGLFRWFSYFWQPTCISHADRRPSCHYLGGHRQINVHRALGTKDNPPRRDCWPSFLASDPGHFLFVCFQFCFHLLFDSLCGLKRKATLTHTHGVFPAPAVPRPCLPGQWHVGVLYAAQSQYCLLGRVDSRGCAVGRAGWRRAGS